MSSSTFNLHHKTAPEKLERIMWREAKKKIGAFAHISVCLRGAEDTDGCILCRTQTALEAAGRTRSSLLMEMARKHYYKHKLDRKPAVAEAENGEI